MKLKQALLNCLLQGAAQGSLRGARSGGRSAIAGRDGCGAGERQAGQAGTVDRVADGRAARECAGAARAAHGWQEGGTGRATAGAGGRARRGANLSATGSRHGSDRAAELTRPRSVRHERTDRAVPAHATRPCSGRMPACRTSSRRRSRRRPTATTARSIRRCRGTSSASASWASGCSG